MLLLALGGVVLGFVFLLASLLTDNAAWAWGCIAVCVLAAVLLVVDVVRRRRPARADAGSPSADAGAAEHGHHDGPDTTAGTVPGDAYAGDAEDFAADAPAPAGATAATAAGTAGRGDEPTEVIPADRAAGREPVAAPEPEPQTQRVPEHTDAVTQQIPVVRESEVSAAALLDRPADSEPADGRPVDRDAEPAEETPSAPDGSAAAASTAEVLVVDERPRFHVAGCAWLADRPTIGLPAREAVDLGFTPCAVCRPVTALARA